MSESRDIVPLQACEHPEIERWEDVPRHEAVYRCTACNRKIGIPMLTYLQHPIWDIEEIIGEVFGPAWKEKARQERLGR